MCALISIQERHTYTDLRRWHKIYFGGMEGKLKQCKEEILKFDQIEESNRVQLQEFGKDKN